MPLDTSKIPPEVRVLLPLAEKWGVGDDLQRSIVIDSASKEELSDLFRAVRACPELFEWLAGPESYSTRSTEEYIVFSNLEVAYEYAKVLLQRRETKTTP